MPTIRETRYLRSARVQEATRRHCSRPNSFACTKDMPHCEGGGSRSSIFLKLALVDLKRRLHRSVVGTFSLGSNLSRGYTAFNGFLKPRRAVVSTPPPQQLPCSPR